ncbi:hypothetical protein PtA15_3A736 [Puccinia triticina]|uniref:Uncharacterized protein n=1 Tax=Puccinia triticina TaxID=208348 RepID=A0ABY7CGT9_9BASI|nr:uncharacterized protein PtA15_3A736 [Puccinia triticina]WAQ83366.1 hypothetical protein PtA15_3A736 [Puccinia triticina]
MANAQDTELSGLLGYMCSLGGEHGSPGQIKFFEQVINNEVTRIGDKYYRLSDRIVNRPDPLALFNQLEIRMELINQLQSKHFPSLKRQVISLSNALIGVLSSPDFKDKPFSKIKQGLKVLAKLDVTMDKIKFAIACIDPDLDPQEVKHDQDFKKAKLVTCNRLGAIVNVVTGAVVDLLRSMELAGPVDHPVMSDYPLMRTEMLAIARSCSASIDTALELMNMSELRFIRDGWELQINSMDDSLKKYITFVNRPAPRKNRSNRNNPSNIARLNNHPRTKASVVAVIKLTRLFLAKLEKMSADKKNFSMVSNLSSRELDMFSEIATKISESIVKLVKALSGNSDANRFQDILAVHDSITQLQSAPKTILFMCNHIFLPVVHQADQPSHKMYYKAWFYHWNRLHQLATRNSLKAFKFNSS